MGWSVFTASLVSQPMAGPTAPGAGEALTQHLILGTGLADTLWSQLAQACEGGTGTGFPGLLQLDPNIHGSSSVRNRAQLDAGDAASLIQPMRRPCFREKNNI